MIAVRVTHPGSTEPVVQNVAEPELAPDEVLVRVATVGVNQLDLNVLAGTGPGAVAALPRTLGIDPAGVVIAQGEAVAGDRIGQRVVVKPNIPCGSCAYCAAGDEGDCPSQSVVGVHRDGGAAELVAVPSASAFPIGELDFAVATAAVHSVPIAMHAIKAAGGLRAGDRVLVTGASGSVGRAAVQLALRAGAEVLAASRSGLGFAGAETLHHRDAGELRSMLAAGEGMNVAIDASGNAEVIAVATDALAWRGVLAFCSASVSSQLSIDARSFYLKRKRLVGTASAGYSEVAEAIDLVAGGLVVPHIARRHPIADAPAAYTGFRRGGSGGKVVLDVA